MTTTADSVAIFAEGTFEEQIQELVNYIVRNRSEEERAAFIRPFQDALKTEPGKKPLADDEGRRRKIFSMVLADVKTLGDGSEKEIEGFFNLLNAHLLSLYPLDSPETKQYVSALIQTISSASPEQNLIKYRLLSNLFNALPRKSPLRLTVYKTLLDLAVANDELEALQLSRTDVEKWTVEWDVPSEDKSAFLKTLAQAYEKFGQPKIAYDYSLAYVRSLPPGSPTVETAAVEIIASALSLPFVFDFDPLFKLDAVVAAKNHELFALLQIFLNDGLSEFKSWQASHAGAAEKYQIDTAQLERKIRLLTLASLGCKHVGQDLPYAKVADALQVPPAEVEKWVIDVIRAGLLSGKLSQTSQTLHITRATARTFEREQWEALEKRLVAWKTGLAGVLDVVAQARKQGAPHTAPTQTQAQIVAT